MTTLAKAKLLNTDLTTKETKTLSGLVGEIKKLLKYHQFSLSTEVREATNQITEIIIIARLKIHKK